MIALLRHNRKYTAKEITNRAILIAGTVLAVSLVMSLWFSFFKSLQITLGFIYFFVLPGYIWSYYFWESSQLESILRIIASFLLSIAITPLTVYLSGKASIPITLFSALIMVGIVNIVGLTLVLIGQRKRQLML